jgi:hypothetical protein
MTDIVWETWASWSSGISLEQYSGVSQLGIARIWTVLTGVYGDFSWSLQANAMIVFCLGYDCFLPNPNSLFISHATAWYSVA